MKRGEKMLSRFTNIIQNAVEALAPQEMFLALEILKIKWGHPDGHFFRIPHG